MLLLLLLLLQCRYPADGGVLHQLRPKGTQGVGVPHAHEYVFCVYPCSTLVLAFGNVAIVIAICVSRIAHLCMYGFHLPPPRMRVYPHGSNQPKGDHHVCLVRRDKPHHEGLHPKGTACVAPWCLVLVHVCLYLCSTRSSHTMFSISIGTEGASVRIAIPHTFSQSVLALVLLSNCGAIYCRVSPVSPPQTGGTSEKDMAYIEFMAATGG